jgi:hypothetical protein
MCEKTTRGGFIASGLAFCLQYCKITFDCIYLNSLILNFMTNLWKEMGLGKTLQSLLLCCAYENLGITLVVCPVGLMRRPWAEEAESPHNWGSKSPFKYLIYHGTNRYNIFNILVNYILF